MTEKRSESADHAVFRLARGIIWFAVIHLLILAVLCGVGGWNLERTDPDNDGLWLIGVVGFGVGAHVLAGVTLLAKSVPGRCGLGLSTVGTWLFLVFSNGGNWDMQWNPIPQAFGELAFKTMPMAFLLPPLAGLLLIVGRLRIEE